MATACARRCRREPRGPVALCERGRLAVGQRIGRRDDPPFVGDHLAGVAPQATVREDAVAHRQPRHVRADLTDPSRDLTARHERQGWFDLIQALHEQGVDEVHASRSDVDAHLARAAPRGRPLFDRQIAQRSERCTRNDTHASGP